jgi:hypothetical protein
MRPTTEIQEKDAKRRGVTSIEFVLVATFFYVPMIVGVLTTGFSLVRAMQAIEITRDAGHMFGEGIDFSLQNNQNILTGQIGAALGMTANNGNVTGGSSGSGVIVLSLLTEIGATQCTGCTNLNHVVVTRRIVIGNNTLYKSPYGGAMTIDSSTGDVQNYLTDSNARADNFSNILSLTAGQMAFLSESYFVPGPWSGASAYNYAVF